MKHSILVVDDEADNVDALERLFRKKYRVLKATSGAEGLAHLQREKIALIVTDQRMPQMTGVEFLVESMQYSPDAIRILLTGYTDIDSVIDAINAGQVYRYVTKPWDPVDLTNAVDKAIERYDLSAELREKNLELKAALNELRVLDQAKSNFMILINHELKTPLTVILSYLDLLRESKVSEEQEKFLGRIGTAASRLHNLIEDSLQLVQAETGLLQIEKSSVKIDKLVGEVIGSFDEDVTKKNMNIHAQVGVKSLKADPSILKSVLQRLIDNAVKFGKEGTEVSVFVSENDSGTGFIIENQGKSLSKETIQRILKPFALDENVMHHSKGTGLGLSVSQALLHRHGSELHIECPSGRFQVSFTIPA